MPIIGLVGGIGAGKSAVAGILAEAGCVVADSDAHAREAFRDPEIRRQLLEWWGDSVLDDDGAIDRRRVARIVFDDPEERRRLERLTHPWIEARRRDLFAAAPQETRALVIDAPLLMEAGLADDCHAVIFVDTPRPMRLTRLRAERGWDDAELARREESQLPLDVKRQRADYVVRNHGDLRDLKAQIHTVLCDIVDTHRRDPR